jgi:hypothetical protein
MQEQDKSAYREGTTPGGRKYDVDVDRHGNRSVNVYGKTFYSKFTNSTKMRGAPAEKVMIGDRKCKTIGRGPNKPLLGGTRTTALYHQPLPGKTIKGKGVSFNVGDWR